MKNQNNDLDEQLGPDNKRMKINDNGITTSAKDFDEFQDSLNQTIVSPPTHLTSSPTSPMVLEKENQPSEVNKNIIHSENQKGEVNKISYNYSDQGPYVVFLDTLKIPLKSNGIEDVKIGKLMKLKKLSEFITDMRKCGKHRMKITFRHRDKANSLINDKNLITENLKAFIPLQFIQRIGIVKNVDPDISEEDLLENTTCKGNIKIKSICRFMKVKKDKNNKETRIPLETVKIIFSGQQLPDEVEMYGVKKKINTYLFYVTQCFQCYKFGHAKKSCRSKQKNCKNCGSEKHKENDEECSELSKCINCKQHHDATDKNCREYIRQSAIKKIMSLDNLSYWEANEKFPKVENYFNILEHEDEFPELPEMFKNKNKNMNKELKKTYNMYHSYKEKAQNQHKVWNNKPHYNLPTEEVHKSNDTISHNPHKTDEFEKLITESNAIQTKLSNYLGGESSQSKNPGTLDGLLIDIGIYLKRSEEVLTLNCNGEQTASSK